MYCTYVESFVTAILTFETMSVGRCVIICRSTSSNCPISYRLITAESKPKCEMQEGVSTPSAPPPSVAPLVD